jgi:hypothetical protein
MSLVDELGPEIIANMRAAGLVPASEVKAAVQPICPRKVRTTARRNDVLTRDQFEAVESVQGSVVYFVQAESGGPIKVGTTDRMRKRLTVLQSSCPVRLRVLATMPGGRDEEIALHIRFDRQRLHGEWFEPHDDLIGFIRNNARGAR